VVSNAQTSKVLLSEFVTSSYSKMISRCYTTMNSRYISSSIVFNFQNPSTTLHVTINGYSIKKQKSPTARNIRQTTHFCSRTNHAPLISIDRSCFGLRETNTHQASPRAVKSHTDFIFIPICSIHKLYYSRKIVFRGEDLTCLEVCL
jgi:hypothetical protein